MKISPGIGIGVIKFGIKESQLISILGIPEEIMEAEYIEGSGNWYKVLDYSSLNLDFTFDQEDDYRLGSITVFGADHTLFDKHLFEIDLKTVSKIITKQTNEIAKVEDFSNEFSPDYKC